MAITLSASLQLKIQDFTSKLSQASARADAFTEKLSKSYKEANTELHRHTLGLKDTARIIQGIVVSQAFYAVAGSIRDATKSLMEFNEQLDYAKVTYSALFGDAKLANDFVKVLQDKSVDTIFEYSDLAGASKKLLAYGIEYENLMYVMNGLTNLGAMSGDTAAMDRIALAMGQIQTTGYLAATEMRQLANAYVPIYDIVQNAFGLTGDQMANVGDLKLPAYQALNAIVDYANAKFGSVGEAAMLTITGLKNRIIDTMKVMGSEMMMPLTNAWKSFLAYFAGGLEQIRAQYNARGFAGIFESLVPDPGKQETIRTFFANLHNLIMTVASALTSLGSLVGIMAEAFAIAFNIVAPPIMFAINVLSSFVRIIADSALGAAVLRGAVIAAAAAFVVLKVHALGALVITAVTKAVNGLSKAMLLLSNIVVKHPIVMLVVALGAALVGLSAASGNAENALTGLFSTMSKLGGNTGAEDIFKETTGAYDDMQDAYDQFDNPFEAGTEGAEELGDAINGAGDKAKKASKSLLSFDEVFRLQDNTDAGAYDGSGYNAGTIADLIGDLGALGDALIPEVPDFTGFIDEFTNDLFGGMFDKINTIASGGLTGTLIGGLAGFAIGALVTNTMQGALAGAKLGTKIGGAAGAGFAAFWTDTYNELERTLQSIAVGGALGTLVGGITGLLIGAFATRTVAGALTGARYGSAIGTLAGGALGGLFSSFSEELSNQVKQIAWGSAYGMLVGGLVGILLGAFATRTLEGALTGARYGTAIASGIGGVIGGTLQGVFGDAETTIGEYVSNMFSSVKAASTGSVIGGLVGMIIGAIVGAFAGGVGALPGAKLGATLGSAIGGLGAMIGDYLVTSGIAENIGEWFSSLWSSIIGWFTKVGTDISNWFTETGESISNWFTETKEKFSTKMDEIRTNWETKWRLIGTAVSLKFGEISSKLTVWFGEFIGSNRQKLEDVAIVWKAKWDNIKNTLTTWWDKLKTSMGTWLEDKVWKPIADFFNLEAFWNRLKGLLDAIGTKISNWWNDITSIFSTDVEVKGNVNFSGTRSGGGFGGSGGSGVSLAGHAAGGVFNREHIARFAEGDKAEAIIPLENASAMQPFVNAVSQGIIEGLAPTLLQVGGSQTNNLPPMYVGTLIADDRGIKQLYKKFELIQLQENTRKGLT